MPDETGKFPRKRRIVLCMGAFCNQGGRAEPFYERLQQELGDPMPPFMASGPVSWETANCLSMCGAGPNLIVYPDDVAYHHLNMDKLDRIIRYHLYGDTSVELPEDATPGGSES